MTVHDHVSWPFDDLSDWREALVPFFAEGAGRGQRLLYTSPVAESELLEDLAGLPGRDALLESGQLIVLSHAVPPSEQLAAVRLVQDFAGVIDSALADGYSAVRLATRMRAGDLTTQHGHEPGSGLAAFELFVDRLISSRPILALCGFDALAQQDALEAVRVVHPLRRTDEHATGAYLFAQDHDAWALAGEIDLGVRLAVDSALEAVAADDRVTGPEQDLSQHVDLTNLQFVDVGGLRTLVELAGALRPGGLVLQGCSPWVAQMLHTGWGEPPGLEIRLADQWRRTT